MANAPPATLRRTARCAAWRHRAFALTYPVTTSATSTADECRDHPNAGVEQRHTQQRQQGPNCERQKRGHSSRPWIEILTGLDAVLLPGVRSDRVALGQLHGDLASDVPDNPRFSKTSASSASSSSG